MKPTAHIYGIAGAITTVTNDASSGVFYSPQLAFDVLSAAGHEVIQWEVYGASSIGTIFLKSSSPAPKETL